MPISKLVVSELLRQLSPICVPIARSSPDALLAQSAALLPEFPFQELRLDALPDPPAALEALRVHTQSHPEAMLLATCRRTASGGHFAGSVWAERQILIAAAHAGCQLVDFALESAETLGSASALGSTALVPLQEAGAAVILSWHDFAHTGDLYAVLERMRPFAPDLVKLVPTAETLADNLPLLRMLESARESALPVVGIAMGEAGAASRILGLRAGGAFTFAPATLAEATAPGQIAALPLRDLYRIRSLRPATSVYGVAGNPVHSSLSPLMLNTAFRKADVDATYLPLLAKDAGDAVRFANGLPMAGFSVTMPLKQSILPLLDRVDPLAARIGAVNTVRRDADGTLWGFNTDAAGITVPLESRLSLQGARVVVLGAGGAARAAVFACVEAGAHVTVVNRTHASAVALADEAGARALRLEELETQPEFDVLIQATPTGMRHNTGTQPPLEMLLCAALIFDLVYNPLETPLLQAARRQGREILHGAEMFVCQGARQFELWTGRPAPVQSMREVVSDALAQRTSASG